MMKRTKRLGAVAAGVVGLSATLLVPAVANAEPRGTDACVEVGGIELIPNDETSGYGARCHTRWGGTAIVVGNHSSASASGPNSIAVVLGDHGRATARTRRGGLAVSFGECRAEVRRRPIDVCTPRDLNPR